MATETDTAELMTLRVTRCEPAALDIRVFEFRHPDGADLPAFTPGAHIGVRVPTGAMRTYSLCHDPSERDRYVIAVKREAGGRGGSIALVDDVAIGDTIMVTPPRNAFELVANAPSHIFIAGGIGITPIRAMIHALAPCADRLFHLYYLTRAPEMTAFRAELTSERWNRHVTLHHDGGDPARAFDLWPVLETPTKAHVYCCGPRPLMDAVRDMTGHWPSSAVHFEDFGADLVRPRRDDTAFEVQLGVAGPVLAVPVGASILEIVRAAGRRVPSSCESGTCGTCRTRVLAGEPDHRDLVPRSGERRNDLMICVSRAKTPRLVLDL